VIKLLVVVEPPMLKVEHEIVFLVKVVVILFQFKSTDVDKVIAAMAGQTFKAPSGITSMMDPKNHHLHKSVFIGEVKADGQFNVVWKTPGPVKAKQWSPYIEGNDKKHDEPAKK
jgi:urea transport system substrate-binding protein